jgi:hypothetical protein
VGINTFTAKALPVITLLSTFGGSLVNSISPNGNPTLVNALVTGGTGTYTFRWTLNNVNVANSMVSTTGSSNTFIATDHGAGTYVFNVIATDTGTTSSYDLVQVSNAMLVPSASGVSSSSGGGANVNTYTTTQTTTVTTTVGILQTSTNVSAGKASLGETINVSAGVNHNINFSNTQTSILITTSSSSPVAAVVHVTNVTVSSAAAPPGYQKLSATNVSVNSSAVVTLTLVTKYPCGLPARSVAPYKLSKGVWVPIKPFSVNTAACTVTLSIASNDPVVALMQSPQTTTAPTTSAYTTMPTSSIAPTTTIQQPAYTSGSSTTTVAVIVVVIIALALLAYWLLGRKKGYTAWKKKQ